MGATCCVAAVARGARASPCPPRARRIPDSAGAESFPRAVRLRKSRDFRRVQRGSRKWVSPDLVVRWSENPEGTRFGLAVSRKVGNAVTRNRVKRWLREAVRRERGVVASVDVVLIARPSAALAGYERLREQVRVAFARIGATRSRALQGA